MTLTRLTALCTAFISQVIAAQAPATNSNSWPVYRDNNTGFHISYPTGWVIVPAKGSNVRFSVNPQMGAGNCNVVMRPKNELKGMTQEALSAEIESLPTDPASWAEYIGLSLSHVRVIETRRARIHTVPAIIGIVETTLENLEGKFTRKQMLAITFRPGRIWSLNCGASTFQPEDARARFAELQPVFNKVFGSFAFLK